MRLYYSIFNLYRLGATRHILIELARVQTDEPLRAPAPTILANDRVYTDFDCVKEKIIEKENSRRI